MGNIRTTHTSPGIYTAMRIVPRRDNRYALRNTKTIGVYRKQSGGGGDTPITTVWVFGDVFPIVFS